MNFERTSGILLHPTSLPGRFGIGDIGPMAHRWLDFLAQAGCKLWQVLPLGPTGYGDSPYQCFSSVAGNPYLISPEELAEDGLIDASVLADLPEFPQGRVDYGMVISWKLSILEQAFNRYEARPAVALSTEFDHFTKQQSHWLDDFCLFMTLKEIHAGHAWHTWEPTWRKRHAETIQSARQTYAREIKRHAFWQFLFFRQWSKLKTFAAQKHLQIIGDIPIYVAQDSSDVWANQPLFFLDEMGKPSVVAGVPPDYFSKTGQLWGNPLYRWHGHAEQNYDWWVGRVQACLSLVDIIRLDHFRGFAGYWEIPGDAKTAEIGRWLPGPGKEIFEVLKQRLGSLPLIAEDLGVITPDVAALRDAFDFPGMKILQFAFSGGSQNPFLPHHYLRNCVVYTGTHDNDTARGWYERVAEEEKSCYRRYLNRDGSQFAWDLIRAAWASVANFALAPLQDFLNLGNEARMNYPGSLGGNWSWRMDETAMNADLAARIRELNELYSRMNTA